jgi:hypothetical protein
MNNDYQSALDGFRLKLADLVKQNHPTLPPEHRALLVALASDAFDSLRIAVLQGPDRLGAIKLVLQMCGVLKGHSKALEVHA